MRYLALCLMLLLPPSLAAAQIVAIENVHVVALDNGQALRDHAVLVEDGRIVAITPMADYAPADGARRIDGGGGWLVPGLVDTHVHIEEYMGARPDFGDAPVFLRHGITSIFNLRGFPEQLPLRDRIAAGELLAPTFYTSGEFVNEPRVNTPDEAAAEVRAQAQAGYDMIKFREVVDHEVGVLTTHGVDLDTFRAVYATARELGIPVLGHAPHGLGLEAALQAGHTFAHMGELVKLHFFPSHSPFAWRPYLYALAGLAVLAILALLARPFARGAGPVLARALPALLLAAGGFALAVLLLPGGYHYGNSALIALLAVALAALTLLGLHAAWQASLRGGGPVARLGLALTAVCALIAGGFGLAQDFPVAARATPAEMDRIAARLAETGAHVGTTLVLYDELAALQRGGETRIAADAADALDPEFRDYFARVRGFFSHPAGWRGLFTYEGALARYDDFTREMTGALHRAGVPLLAGTDAFGVGIIPPGRSLHAELEILVEAGLTPYQALRTATVEPARFLGREHEFGRIAPGQRADLVLLAADPLADIRAIAEPRGVMLRGQWLPRDTLDAMVDALRTPPSD